MGTTTVEAAFTQVERRLAALAGGLLLLSALAAAVLLGWSRRELAA